MPELEEIWTDVLREAKQHAANLGRKDVLEYLNLREANDTARRVGIQWLLQTFLDVANEAKRRGLNLSIEETEPHSFAHYTAIMRGAKVKLTLGVRALTVEAGFPRTPQDGFVRGGGLACAKISHFGLPKSNADLLLVKSSNPKEAPIWFAIDENNLRQPFSTAHLKNHFAVFLGQI